MWKGRIIRIVYPSIIFLILLFFLILSTAVYASAQPINVPFLPQVPPGSWGNLTKNCGSASSDMIFSYLENKTPKSNDIKKIDDWLHETYGNSINNYNGSDTTPQELKNLAEKYKKFEASSFGHGNFAWLKNEIKNGYPVVVLVNVNMHSWQAPHYMVVIGITNSEIIMNDPGKTFGARRHFALDNFKKVWATQNNSYVVIRHKSKSISQPKPKLQPKLQSQSVFSYKPQFQHMQSFLQQFFFFVSKILHLQIQTVFPTSASPKQHLNSATFQYNNTKVIAVKNTTTTQKIQKQKIQTTYTASVYSGQTIHATPDTGFARVVIQAKNTGTATWRRSMFSVNVVGGQRKNAQFYDQSWLTALRPTLLDQLSVAPGQNGTFTFTIRIPTTPRKYVLRLWMVHQNGNNFISLNAQPVVIPIYVRHKRLPYSIPKTTQQTQSSFQMPSLDNLLRQMEQQENRHVVPPVTQTVQPVQQKIHTTKNKLNRTHSFVFNGSDVNTPAPKQKSIPVVQQKIVNTSTTVSAPIMFLLIPSTTPFTTASSLIIFTGRFNTSTAHILVSGTTSTVLMNTSTQTWSVTTTLFDTTNTFYFHAWDTGFTTSSVTTTVTVLYQPQIPLPAPIITMPTVSSTYTTTTASLLLSGERSKDMTSVFLSFASSTVTTTIATGTWKYTLSNMATGTYSISVWGTSANGQTSPSTTITLSITPKSTEPTFEPSVYAGDVVFSEIGWMGTRASSNDEWMELYNTTVDRFVPDSGWTVVWGKYNPQNKTFAHTVILDDPLKYFFYDLQFQEGTNHFVYTSPKNFTSILFFQTTTVGFLPQSFLFLERTDETTMQPISGQLYTGALKNSGEHLRLLDRQGKLVDEVNASGGWFAGNKHTHEAMERILDATDGNASSSWYTFTQCQSDFSEFVSSSVRIPKDADGNPILGEIQCQFGSPLQFML